MTSATLTEIAKARPHDEWLQLKLSERMFHIGGVVDGTDDQLAEF
jgi:hypothetical protein